ncbi:MAG TPA: phosphohistidine phosphatase SixA [Bacteroidota bacterium]
MLLYFLRHGDAIESPYYHDSERPLSDLGKRQIQTVAQFFKLTRKQVELVLSSPLGRARETADILQQTLKAHPTMTTEALLSGSEVRNLLNEMNLHKSESMLLVGHEPQLSSAISVLTGGDEHFRVEMRKASLACVESPFPVKKGGAVLSWLITVAQMELMR